MLQNLYYPTVRFKLLPPILGLSLGGILGLLLSAFVLGQRGDQQTTQLFSEYGNALATLTAVRAVDSAVNRDLVALHALLQDVLAQDRAVFATVRDIDNTLLVQAGDSYWQGATQEFNAVIPLQDNFAGTVTVTLSEDFSGDQAIKWAVTGTAGLLLLMVLLSLYECYGSVWWINKWAIPKKEKPLQTQTKHRPSNSVDNELQSDGINEAAITATDHAARCVLTLTALNGSALQKQLSGDLFESLESDFELKLKHVVSLYGGKITGEGSVIDSKTVEFYADERTSEALFQSVCAAHLLNALVQNAKFRFKLNAYASVNGNQSLIKRDGIFCENVETSAFLSARLDVEEIEDNVFWVRGLKAPFSELVEQQIMRLKEVSSS